MSLRTRLPGLVLLGSALVLAGCQQGNPNAPATVSGKVTYNGKPVTGGSITFHPADGAAIPIPIGANGEYMASDIRDGQMTVTIETESINPNKKKDEGTSRGPVGYPGGGMPRGGKGYAPAPPPDGAAVHSNPVYMKIPEKYADKATSGLSVTLKRGAQKKDFDLTD